MSKSDSNGQNDAVMAVRVGLPEGVLIALREAGASNFKVVEWGYGGILTHSGSNSDLFADAGNKFADAGSKFADAGNKFADIGRRFADAGRRAGQNQWHGRTGGNTNHEKRPKHFLCFSVPPEKFGDIDYLNDLRHELPESFQTFFFQAEGEHMCIGAKSLKQFEIVKYVAPCGENTGVYVDDVLETLMRWDQKYGVTVEQIGKHFVQIRLERLPDNIGIFAREVWRFCASVFERGRIDNYADDEVKSAIGAFEQKFSTDRLLSLRWD